MTTITRNLPWFVKDLGVAIVGEVSLKQHLCPGRVMTYAIEMLCLSSREFGHSRCRLPEILVVERPRLRHCRWWLYYESASAAPKCVVSFYLQSAIRGTL